MQNDILSAEFRRSSRVAAELPIRVTSLAGTYFSEMCKTLVVNAHGCALQTPVKFESGVPLRFHSKDGRETTARVISCQPIGPDNRTWRLGAQLDRPENFWRLSNCPEDWTLPAVFSAKPPQLAAAMITLPANQNGQTLEAKLDLVAQRLEAPLKKMIAASLAPLEAQLTVLKETVARREANPSRFEVSLSSIPPELERQLEARLRKDLGPQVLEESRQQYAHLLETAKSTIDQRTSEGYAAFSRRAEDELKIVEKRAQELSLHMSANADEHIRGGLRDFQQRLLDGGNSLKRLSEQLLEFLGNNLNDDYNARRQELEQLHAAVAEEYARLRKDMEHLGNRVARLDESAHSLEAGLDKRLSNLASNTMKDSRSQLESMVAEVLEQFIARSAKTVEDRLAEASGQIATTHDDRLASFSGSLKLQTANALEGFEQSMGELAKLSVERWRLKLAGSFNTLAKNLGEQFQMDAESANGKKGA
jgi:hypothetical protein